ncbi:2-succinyl-5-enolpyruvyl-6-hydroxy-3-cyclohexene-1-carboxylic-acid synthase [Nocardioides sp. Kera G14]|uniref:2-succinyl-5-enolpyruvyl-6-hydroxy-3- cyclohexene-1-carboxylic-acid synthase n=1 Tax=Nocardioides sp. Kera G14 TaxID=2884264 RepID=UPI001D1197D9|nr:2-succinyl-5-enolpyruvyl-6-hydroxy-3-cyclohexene-1-carboxylic-acid synthase [Nocardioides sp. Kera G14]UDY23896.1 2-succinyl-5-enolpyruvyl-6-hydroxy-3-cyclohexene-1-carboxylic-acid synthase [Nocardioides sp. Kera G14]
MNPSTELARAVVTALIEAGVREVVLAPGSRNAPLSYAVHDADAAGLIRLHVRVDERSAAFLALGLTKTGSRAAVMCTSGTAVTNLHPALLEAAHAGVALVAVTADRPARLRGTDANQTTDQVGVFGPLIPTDDLASAVDVDSTPVWEATGPTHWNVQFDEPLLPEDVDEVWTSTASPRPAHQWPTPRILESIDAGLGSPRTVVVAGDDAGPAARRLAEAAGWPLLAEPSSGSRTGAHALRAYRLLLADDSLRKGIERVVVYGHPTLSRPVSRLLSDRSVEVWAEARRTAWGERSFPVARTFRTELQVNPVPDSPSGNPGLEWLAEWQAADRAVSRQLDALLAEQQEMTGHQVAAAVAAAIPPGSQLVVGPSNPIRDLDLMHRPTPVGERRKILSNRGLAGIDGVVSTAIGAALGRTEAPTYALMGDLTFLHDANGLIIGPGEPRPESLTIVVANDDGGSIFATLEQGAPERQQRFERVFGTPHGTSIEQLCAATRTPYARVTTPGELAQILQSPNGGVEVVEAVISRTARRELDEQIRELRA